MQRDFMKFRQTYTRDVYNQPEDLFCFCLVKIKVQVIFDQSLEKFVAIF